ncbi:MAG: ABC transporter permease subunit [Clostridia bacterium]|nr:ABC transporter permease subunit [Clostridia bacterium]
MTLAKESEFWVTAAASLLRILEGFILGLALGFGTALLTHYIPVARALISPFLKTVRAIPVVSFILLAFLWLDNNAIPIFIAILMVVPIIWENMTAGLSSLDKNLLEAARVFNLSRKTTLSKIILPSLSPYIYSGSLTALGLAWKSGIAAEVISYPTIAIGKAMNNAKVTLETADVLVWTVVVVALSLIFEGIIKLIFKKGRKRV